MKHTKEPWTYNGAGTIWTESMDQQIIVTVAPMTPLPATPSREEHFANLARVTVCVNALAGIDDPAAWRTQAEEALREAKDALKKIRYTKGKVCTKYEMCEHPACASSYESWAIADAALNKIEVLKENHNAG